MIVSSRLLIYTHTFIPSFSVCLFSILSSPQQGNMYPTFGADEDTDLQSTNIKSDSFIVEMERFSHSSSKNVSPINSRITCKLSRKGSNSEKKMNSNADTEKGGKRVDSSTPEKPILVTVGATSHPFDQHISITTPNTTTETTESKLGCKRNSFKRSSSWTIAPRRILFFFATLSSMGTILLIYLTLSMKNGGRNAHSMG
ncbi:uncharacterized protein LOC108215241 isoform X2 [Daucus carota subsp. sativus]|uniref:uncharacterized protein LOC108215241 isoform X2 n=1 Tax=Daucus carota subsp. sativus TaxID=79200 RepID=UPI0007EF46DD|nr:PREDICTED: uncharacterized protein LOC108215241 isoform X2 [Daucus carota subsp. sativus]